MNRNKIIGAIALILVIIAIYTTVSKNNAAANSGQEATGTKPPAVTQTATDGNSAELAFTLKDMDGNSVSLSDFKGKKVYVNFWATWCPYCIQELPDIERLYKETKDSDLVILVVDIGEDAKTVQDFITQNKYTFKVLLDTDGAVATRYGINTLPRSFFIDSQGKISAMIPGMMDYEQMKEQIELLQ